jgi:alanine dehydrogenase
LRRRRSWSLAAASSDQRSQDGGGTGRQGDRARPRLERLRYLSDVMPATSLSSTPIVITSWSRSRRRPGDRCGAHSRRGGPRVIRRGDLKTMQPGAVIVDVAIDQGGCVETIHATTHENPTYVGRWNHPLRRREHAGGVPRTSTLALTNATFPMRCSSRTTGGSRRFRTSCRYARDSTLWTDK